MTLQNQDLLSELCQKVYDAEEAAERNHKHEKFGDQFTPEYLVQRIDSVRIEIRKEIVSHHEPHMHITHSDKIDVSLSLTDFRILAGEIDKKALKKLMPWLQKCKIDLMKIWNALNVEGDSIKVERLISNLPGT